MSSLIERVCTVAEDNKAHAVTDIHVLCGELSGVVPSALEFCFDVCIADTCAANATLHIEYVDAQWKCHACGAEHSHLDDASIPLCRTCGSRSLTLCRGREFQLTSIRVE